MQHFVFMTSGVLNDKWRHNTDGANEVKKCGRHLGLSFNYTQIDVVFLYFSSSSFIFWKFTAKQLLCFNEFKRNNALFLINYYLIIDFVPNCAGDMEFQTHSEWIERIEWVWCGKKFHDNFKNRFSFLDIFNISNLPEKLVLSYRVKNAQSHNFVKKIYRKETRESLVQFMQQTFFDTINANTMNRKE